MIRKKIYDVKNLGKELKLIKENRVYLRGVIYYIKIRNYIPYLDNKHRFSYLYGSV